MGLISYSQRDNLHVIYRCIKYFILFIVCYFESNPGKLRNRIVCISGTNYVPLIPFYENVRQQINWVNKIENPIDKGLEIFVLSSRGQWFNNGNKRTAQMLANHLFLQENAAILAIPDIYKELFTKYLVNYYESSDNLVLKNFLYETSVEMLSSGLMMRQLKEIERLC